MNPSETPQEIFAARSIPPAQRELVSCSCGALGFVPLAAVYADKLNVAKREIELVAFLHCLNCGKTFPSNAPAKSKVQPD